MSLNSRRSLAANHGLELTASSVRSCLAPASGCAYRYIQRHPGLHAGARRARAIQSCAGVTTGAPGSSR